VAGVALSEAEDVLRVGKAPCVNNLVVVTADAQVPVGAGEQVDERRCAWLVSWNSSATIQRHR
jgi:hypothetical protein